MKQLESLHIPTPKLIHFIKLEELNKCVQVFEWAQGVKWSRRFKEAIGGRTVSCRKKSRRSIKEDSLDRKRKCK